MKRSRSQNLEDYEKRRIDERYDWLKYDILYHYKDQRNKLLEEGNTEALDVLDLKIKEELNNAFEKAKTGAKSDVYRYVKPLPKKDNTNMDNNPFNYGNVYSSIIRVPSLKRKSAWKRFYKRFPGLKGRDSMPGHSTSNGHKLPDSTIKLKKI